jgi:endo-1,4-beta-xylanase
MVLSTVTLAALSAAVGIVGAFPFWPKAQQARQDSGRFATQYWANDYATLDYNDLGGGEYNVSWDNGFGGNFVVGKGYSPGGYM